jgi:hypothetical protein
MLVFIVGWSDVYYMVLLLVSAVLEGAMDLFRLFDQKVYESMLAFHKKECVLMERLSVMLIENVIKSQDPSQTLTVALAHSMHVAHVYVLKTLTAKAFAGLTLSASERAHLIRMSADDSFQQIFMECHCTINPPIYGLHTQ